LRAVAHAIYGEPLTINCANYTYFLALELVHNSGSAKAVKVFVGNDRSTSLAPNTADLLSFFCVALLCEIAADELLHLHRGQGWDIYWRDNYQCPTLEMYEQMVLDS
jgi:geranylgeranyl diphosphate synthase type 3